ncbi:MAG: phage holin, LLH family [bacterium]
MSETFWLVTQALLLALIPVVIAAVGTLARVLWVKWRGEISAEQLDYLERVAAQAVLFAEQVYKDADGETKKAAAIAAVQAKLDARGIHVDLDQIVAAIEAAVYDEITRDKLKATGWGLATTTRTG